MIHDSEKNKLMELAYSLGYEYEKNYRGCAQCTVAAVQDALDIKSDILFKAASGLATGGGLLCDGVCGGYSGGIMIMSSFFGRKRENIDDDHDEKYCSFRMATYLHKKFINKYGSVICKDIHNKIFGRTYDLWNPEEKEAFKEKLITQIEAIKRSKFEPTPGFHCRYCDYKHICEYRKLD